MVHSGLVGILVAAVLLAVGQERSAAGATHTAPMHDIGLEFGKINPNAPAELSQFAFLIGKWRCQAKVRSGERDWQTLQAEWIGRYLLDGHAIADEYRMTDSSGKLIVLGMNFRSYNAAKHTWNIKWLNALSGAWTDLAPSKLGGVHFDGQSISYAFKEPVAEHRWTRATYTSLSDTHFTWRGDKSDDAKHWTQFMVCDCYRSRD
jgi:hypothetical protein